MENCKIRCDCTLPPTKSETEKISDILHTLSGMSIADARLTLDRCGKLLGELLLVYRVPENLTIDFPNVIDG